MTTTLPGLLAPAPLPTVADLRATMLELGCRLADGWCYEHNQSVLIHDGDRVACRVAWATAQGGA